MKFLENVDEELSRYPSDTCSQRSDCPPNIKSKLLELEIEKEEQSKAIDMLKQLREKERSEMRAHVEKAKEEGC